MVFPAGSDRQNRIQIVADVLLTLFQAGWEPMTPLDMGLQMKETGKTGPQVTICFKQNETEHGSHGGHGGGLGDSVQGSRVSLEPGSRRR